MERGFHIEGYSDVFGLLRVVAIVRVGVPNLPEEQREVVYEVDPHETIEGLYNRVWKSLCHLEAASVVLKVVVDAKPGDAPQVVRGVTVGA